MPGAHDETSARAPWWRGTRGEWYVVGQVIIFGLILVGPHSAGGLPSWTGAVRYRSDRQSGPR